jgi:uncharacterized protein YdhG (YjbR/CyaY superfamily)
MEPRTKGITTVDEYIALFPEEVQEKLKKVREVIRSAAPEAVERISYQMPAFNFHGNLVYFAAFTDHISFFPTSSGVAKFKDELSPYDTSKGTVRFPLDQPLPYDLIRRITAFRVKENRSKPTKKK